MTKEELQELADGWLSKKESIEDWNLKHGTEAQKILELREDINYYMDDYDDMFDQETREDLYSLLSVTSQWLPSSMDC